MTLDQLEMLEAIVEEGSMQKAATRIHKSQPSLSVGIKKIEELYGIKIFSRESYRPKLTSAGEVFYQNALEVLSAHRKLHKVAVELGDHIEPKIVMVVDPIVVLPGVSGLLNIAVARRASTQLIINEDVLEGPLDAIVGKKAQFAIGHCPTHRAEEVLKKKLGHIELLPAVKKGANFKNLPNIVVSKDLDPQVNHKQKGSTWYVSSHSRKEELIIGGFGWGRMSKSKIKNIACELTPIKSEEYPNLTLDIFLMVNRQVPLGKVAKEMWDSIK